MNPLTAEINKILQDDGIAHRPDWLEIQTAALEELVKREVREARIDEVYQFLDRSDSLSEDKYATRRIDELNQGEA
jgi:hypothetical protein